jgi:hypothetical protein
VGIIGSIIDMGEAGQMAQKRSKRIPGLEPYRRRPPNGTFETLQFEARRKAQMLLWGFCQRWGNDLPPWRRAILVGQAKRLALNPPDSAWARRTLAKRRASRAREVQAGRDRPDRQGTAARRSKLRTNPPPQPQRRAGMIYILPPGIVPQRA